MLLAASGFLGACQPETPATAVVVLPVAAGGTATEDTSLSNETEIHAPSATVPPTPAEPTLTPTPPPPRVLVICLPEEPQSLYIYGSAANAWRHVQEALRDGPIDERMFGFQPVILEKLPHWEDGDVVLETVRVAPGEIVATVNGELQRLEGGLTYWTPELSEAVAEPDEVITTVQMVVTFRLIDGVHWSDGEPLTAGDSVFGFQTLRSDDTSAPDKYVVRRTQQYKAVDDRTVAWTSVPGFLDSSYFLNFFEPLPAHAYGHLTAAEMTTDELVNRLPLSWGAFRVAEWVADEYLRLLPNEHYFRAAEGLPRLDELVFIFTPDETQALQNVLSGTCHVAVRNKWGAWESSGATIVAAMDNGQLGEHLVPGPLLEHLDFGIAPEEDYFRPAGSGLFQSAAVRRAVAHCLDRQTLANVMQWGRGEVAHSYAPANHPLFPTDSLTTYAFDPARGRSLLAEAGWVDTNGDGLLNQAGKSLQLQYAVNYPESFTGSMRQSIAEIVQASLRETCGIGIEIVPQSGVEMYSEWPISTVFGRQFDLAQYAWLLRGEPSCDLYTSDEVPRAGKVFGQNASGYSRTEFDQACAAALEGQSREGIASAHYTAQQIFAEDLPSLPLFFRQRIGVARPELSGFFLDPTHPSPLWNVEAFSLAES